MRRFVQSVGAAACWCLASLASLSTSWLCATGGSGSRRAGVGPGPDRRARNSGPADLRGVVADACALYDVCDGKISGSRFLSALLDRTAPAVRPAMLADLRRYLDELALSEPAGPIVDPLARVQ